MPEKFDINTATRGECLEKADKMLELGIRAEAAGRELPPGSDRDTKMRSVELALKLACKTEDAAFDGRE